MPFVAVIPTQVVPTEGLTVTEQRDVPVLPDLSVTVTV